MPNPQNKGEEEEVLIPNCSCQDGAFVVKNHTIGCLYFIEKCELGVIGCKGKNFHNHSIPQMSKLQQLTEAIHREIPEILELKFGCKYVDNKDDIILYVRSISNHHYGILQRSMSNTLYGCVKSDAKILGRDIQLADVLRVMNQASIKSFIGDWTINERGHFVKQLVNHQNIIQAERWDLEKTLHLQKPETIDFLCDLIVKK